MTMILTVTNDNSGHEATLISAGAAPVKPMLRWFEFAHLPPKLQAISAPFGGIAGFICESVPASAERTVALRKLLEAKDAAVGASL